MKKIIRASALVAVLLAVGAVLYLSDFSRSLPSKCDAPKVMAAVQTYKTQLKSKGVTLPDSVNLQTLIANGLLRSEDVSAFQGMNVTVTLNSPQALGPQDVLMRARLPDGTELVALTDGSVQEQRR